MSTARGGLLCRQEFNISLFFTATATTIEEEEERPLLFSPCFLPFLCFFIPFTNSLGASCHDCRRPEFPSRDLPSCRDPQRELSIADQDKSIPPTFPDHRFPTLPTHPFVSSLVALALGTGEPADQEGPCEANLGPSGRVAQGATTLGALDPWGSWAWAWGHPYP